MNTEFSSLEVPDRTYTMRRLAAGDYLLPSNDRTVLWRIHSYEDGAFYGIVDCPFVARTFWRAVWMPMEQARAFLDAGELPDPWDDQAHAYMLGDRIAWREVEWHMATRSEAIATAMRHDAQREATNG